MTDRPFYCADLFCGAGGTSTGLLRAAERLGRRVKLIAVNHWQIAVETHSKNHPDHDHLCADLDSLNPRRAVPGGYLDLLWASPECTGHSNAAGRKPKSDQSRATAWCVLRWAEALTIKTILLENVPEFVKWGPLHDCTCGADNDFMSGEHRKGCLKGQPIKEREGEFYNLFLYNLRALGYTVETRILVCADYGDPTTRKRFFLQARKDGKIVWPQPSHEKTDWVPARSIIDWSLKGKSIYNRKTPLKPNTMRRIYAGLEKFGGLSFCLGQQSGATARGVDQPLPTVATAGAISLIEPFLMGAGGTEGQQRPQDIDAPMGTVLTHDRRALVEPYLVVFRNNMDAKPMNNPVPALTTSGGNFGLAQPFLFAMEHASVESGDSRRCYDLDRPLVTVTKKGLFGMVEPYLIQYHGSKGDEQRTATLDAPLPVQDTSNRYALAEPYLIEYYGSGGAESIDDPLNTVTTKDRFGLCQPVVHLPNGGRALLDILFRMLQPHELAAAHSFPAGYQFAGTRDDVVAQIGNSVPCSTAEALCLMAFTH